MSSKWKLLMLLFFLTIAGCAQPEASGNQTPDYESTKKMMVDMLQTEEGKDAIKEIMTTDEELQQAIIMDQAFVRKTVQDTLTSEQGRLFWQETMKDPEFAKVFAENIQKENEELLKTLMKDPEYQEMMMIILKDPEMEKAALDLMQTKEYRQQVMLIMTEALESPYFKAQVNELLTNIVQKQTEKPATESSGEEEDASS